MSPNGPVGVGLIGAGTISTQYLENLTRFPDLHVLFVADIDQERAAAQAQTFGVPASGSVDELLAHPDVEIVINLTIPQAHVEVGLQALAADKHVWSEKPIALDRADARRLLAEAERTGLRVACAPDTLLGAGLQTARRLVDTGEIGRPLTALTLFQSPGPESWHPNPAFLFQEGAGPLFDVGPYYLTTLVQTLGPVSRVTALSSTARTSRTIGSGPLAGQEFPVTVPTHIGGLLEFAGGASAQSVFSFDSALPRAGVVEVSGTSGTVVFPDPNQFTGDSAVWHAGAGEAEQVPASGPTTSRGTGVLELARAIRAGVPERSSGALAYHVLDVMASLSESAERRESVRVESTVEPAPLLPEDWSPTAETLGLEERRPA